MLFIFSRVLCEIPWGYTCTYINVYWDGPTHTHIRSCKCTSYRCTYIHMLSTMVQTSYRNAETFKWKIQTTERPIFCKFDDDENSCTFAAFRMYINTYIHACKRVCVCVLRALAAWVRYSLLTSTVDAAAVAAIRIWPHCAPILVCCCLC